MRSLRKVGMFRSAAIARSLIAISFLAKSGAALAATTSVSFYVSGHEDDWYLFFSKGAVDDSLKATNKTVFIYFTAGDGGCGDSCPSPFNGIPYYKGREQGSVNAVWFLASMKGLQPQQATSSTVTMNGHPVIRYSVPATSFAGPFASYFLRLPDGYMGDGTPATGNQSLLKLRASQISVMDAIDGSTSYTSWTDLVNTVQAIVKSEATGIGTVVINTHDPNETINPGGHSDHYATGAAMQAVATAIPCITSNYYTDDANLSRPQNLTTVYSNMQSALTGIGQSVMANRGFTSEFKFFLDKLIGKNYFRTVQGVSGGSCAF
ncbi:hypothetical protein [Methylocystis parvus]|uniref:hypothetical protein n=1 Tax=Methylocystis parvus TaxID=134 RepID=UPI003C78B120